MKKESTDHSIPYPNRKYRVLLKLSRHLRCGTQMSVQDVDEFGDLLAGFKALAEPQREVYRRLMSGVGHAEIIVRFPDGHLLEVERNPGHTDVREPGGDWQGTMLRRPVHIVEWLRESMVELEAFESED